MRKYAWFAVLVCLVALAVSPAVAQDDEGQIELAGTWVRVVYLGAASNSAIPALITKVGPKDYSALFQGFGIPPEPSSGNLFSNQQTITVGEIERVGLNEYTITSLWYFGQTLDEELPRTTMAIICNGPMTLTENRWVWDAACTASCNPCYQYCWTYPWQACSAEELWDPFTDPFQFDVGGGTVEYRRIPLVP